MAPSRSSDQTPFLYENALLEQNRVDQLYLDIARYRSSNSTGHRHDVRTDSVDQHRGGTGHERLVDDRPDHK